MNDLRTALFKDPLPLEVSEILVASHHVVGLPSKGGLQELVIVWIS